MPAPQCRTILRGAFAGAVVFALSVLTSGAVEVIQDVAYYSPGGRNSRLDVYIPDRFAPASATVVFYHGGALSSGDKSSAFEFCHELAMRGYAAVAPDYTLATDRQPSYPQTVLDAKNVVIWAKGQGGEDYGLPRRVIVAGSSAGGYLAMMVAVTSGVPFFQGIPARPGAYRVDAFVSLWGGSDLVWHVQTFGQDQAVITYLGEPMNGANAGLYAFASPINHVDIYDPPGVFFHGRSDATVPSGHSTRMADAMRLRGTYAAVTLKSGAEHGFDAWGGRRAVAARVADAIPRLLDAGRRQSDFAGDGTVDGDDLQRYAGAFLDRDAEADVNLDGTVDRNDFLSFCDAFFADLADGR
ncbi:MAG: hypothetical protein FJ224_09540 [Lentisphaerae bacterium]|nr:hypothetical protein [Lentisphaerota bacterium]